MTKEMFFHWHHFQEKLSYEPRGIFYLDAPSASVCLLIQLERHATEEGGVTSSVYSRKEPVFAWTSITLSFFLFSTSHLICWNSILYFLVIPPHHFVILEYILLPRRKLMPLCVYMSLSRLLVLDISFELERLAIIQINVKSMFGSVGGFKKVLLSTAVTLDCYRWKWKCLANLR